MLKSVIATNPLLEEDYRYINKSVKHDFIGLMSGFVPEMVLKVPKYFENFSKIFDLSKAVIHSFYQMTEKTVNFYYKNKIERYFEGITSEARINTEGESNVRIQHTKEYLMNEFIISNGVYNVVKNAIKAINAAKTESPLIDIITEDYKGEVENPVFLTHEMLEADSSYGEYLKVTVKDNGPGFKEDPEQVLMKSIQSVHEERNGSHFGLYFAMLACEFHRAHLGIKSEPGNTEVSMYIPKPTKKYINLISS